MTVYVLLGLILFLFIADGVATFRLKKEIDSVLQTVFKSNENHLDHISKLSAELIALSENYDQYRTMNCEDLKRLHEQVDGLDKEFDDIVRDYFEEHKEAVKQQEKVFEGFQNILAYDYETALKGANK